MNKETKELRRIAASLEGMRPVASPRDTARPDRKERMPLRGRLVLFFGASDGRSAKSRAIRRSFPIRACVGPNGGGKSLVAVSDLLFSLDRRRTVLSTVRFLDSRTGEQHPFFEPFYDFDQLVASAHLDVFMDEVVGIANSRDSSKLSPRVQNVLVQLRRRDVTLTWTAPNWARADKIIREVTQAVTECRGYFADRAVMRDGEIALWAPRRVFRFRTFDTVDFEEWTAGKRDRLEPVVSEWFKGPGSRAFASYDTMDAVTQVAHASESGICQVCEGTIKAKPCSCPKPSLPVPVPVGEVIELVERAKRATGRRVAGFVDDSTVVV